MKRKLFEHFISVVLVSLLLLASICFFYLQNSKARLYAIESIRDYIGLRFIDFTNTFEAELFRETLDIFYPQDRQRNKTLVEKLKDYQQLHSSKNIEKSHLTERLSLKKTASLALMYLKFILVYALVMSITYYGVETIGVLRFVARKRRSLTSLQNNNIRISVKTIAKKIGLLISSLILFSPSYVIAYSIRTEFNTDSLFFMILLGVFSNGLLIMYANKFYTFLVGESRKGYVETALAKNLNNSYEYNCPTGLSLKKILRIRKYFHGHILQHIFANARFQYFSSIKEQASFLITGLIIIEMALNIHGHLGYEMLRQILYKNYDIVVVIILGIFYLVKLTEVTADVLAYKNTKKYENFT